VEAFALYAIFQKQVEIASSCSSMGRVAVKGAAMSMLEYDFNV